MSYLTVSVRYDLLTIKIVIYTTITELCPVTETKVVGGSTVEVVWTSTSTLYTKVPHTETVYTTSVATEYEHTNVYETVVCPETVITTVSKGETVYITKTNTITTAVTEVHTYTTVIPQTITKAVDVTIPITKSAGVIETKYSTVVVSANNTIYTSIALPPTTVILPTTSTVGSSPIGETSAAAPPVEGVANVIMQKSPVVALIAGLFGVIAFL